MKISVSLVCAPGVARNLIAALLCVCTGAYAQSPGPGMPQRTGLRVLEQATWGPTTLSLNEVQTSGFDTWFDNQMKATYSPIPDQPLINPANGLTNTNVGPLQVNFFTNTLTGSDQLRQRMAFALSEIWVVSNVDLNNASAFPAILRIFQNRAFGNYRDLMQEITLNPAMGHYLDMVNNDKANPATNTAANENYARELMQLFTLGLDELNMDGTPVLSGTTPVSTYSQTTVTNLAKMLTGWTYAPVAGATDRVHNPINFLVPMVVHEQEHDTTAKTIFGVSIPVGTTALEDVNKALDIIFAQPSIAPFVSKQLIQHLVTSNPSAGYISRVAKAFDDNGSGVRGDLKAVVYQILTDPEARAGDTQPFTSNPTFGHFREPVLFLSNLLRGLNGQLTTASNVQGYSNQLGQNLFFAPSVFSYFAPGFQVNSALAPELQIFTTQTATSRTGVVNSAIYYGHLDTNTTFNLTPFIAAETAGDMQFLSLVNELFFHDAISVQVAKAMLLAMNAVTAPADKAKAGLYIALTSNEYQVIH